MSRQTDLFGAAPSGPRHRLFFALFPEPAAGAAVARVVESLHGAIPNARWIHPGRHHLTLHYLGESHGRRQDLIAQAMAAANGYEGRSFTVCLDHLQALGNPARPALTLAGQAAPALEQFWRGLHARLIRTGLRLPAGHGLLPHLTLAYTDPRPPTPAVAPVALAPAEYQLVHSVEGRVDYEILGRWPLHPDL